MNSAKNKIRVKVMTRAEYSSDAHRSLLRQFPNSTPTWGECEFIFDPHCTFYDWFVVYHDMPNFMECGKVMYYEKLKCPPENTIHINYEPSSITTYGTSYLRQFGCLVSTQEEKYLDHPNIIHWQAGMPWFYGRSASLKKFVPYDDLIDASIPTKSQCFSTVCSTKQQIHTLHKARLKFTQKLKFDIPELEIFGHGHKEIEDKAEALDRYKYHLVIENHQAPNHWTEKLSDSYLGFCLPFYHGCPNVAEYFPEQSVIPIDIYKPNEAKKIMLDSIAANEYENRLNSIKEARNNVLTKHNLFAYLSRLIPSLKTGKVANRRGIVYSRKALWSKYPKARLSCVFEKSKRFLGNLCRTYYRSYL